MRHSIWWSVVAVLLLAVPLVAAGDTVREEAAWYAAEMGVSVEEAARRLELQAAAGELDALLAAEEAATFAGLTIEHQPSFHVVVRFTDPAAAKRLAARVAAGPLRGLVETRPARHSIAELQRWQETMHDAGREQGLEFDSDLDVRGNRLEARTRLDPWNFQARMGQALLPGTTTVRVQRLFMAQALVGGSRGAMCTGGFTVRAADGELGIVTAGHCPDTQEFDGVSLPRRGELDGARSDVQWHGACDRVEVTNEFETGLGLRACTAARPRGHQAVGQYVCKYGASTGRSCGTIASRHFTPGQYQASFTLVNDQLNAAGDSGAPWFDQGTAVGIHQGSASDGKSVYLPIDSLSDLGLSVLTSDPGACTRRAKNSN